MPFAAGSATDLTARGLGAKLQDILKQPVVIDNKPGASGQLGASAVATAPADGYTLLMGTNTTNAANGALFKKLCYDPDKDFAPIIRCVTGVNALVVNNDVPVKSVAELIDYAKKNPGKLNYAEASASQRLSAEMFNQMAGVKIERVPYKASPQALGDVVAGQVQVMFPDLPQALTQIEAGRVRGLGTTGPKRTTVAPDLPAIAETVPGYSLVYWLAVFAPAATPKAVQKTLARRHRRGAQGPGHRQGDDPGPHGNLAARPRRVRRLREERDRVVDQVDQGGRHRAGVRGRVSAMSKVIIEKNGPVKTVWMNRPEKRNALDSELLGEMIAALQAPVAAEDRVLVIRGKGDVFCAGLDMAERSETTGAGEASGIEVMLRAIELCPLPVVAVVQGDAIAGGNELALHCDLVVASQKARFGMSLAQVGLAPNWFLAKKLMEVLGPVTTREMLLLGDPLPSTKLHALGLIARCVPADQLEAEASKVIDRLAANAPLSLKAMKALTVRQLEFRDAIKHDDVDALVRAAMQSQDAQEGMKARLEKRTAKFQGK